MPLPRELLVKRRLLVLSALLPLPLTGCVAVVAAGAAGVGLVKYQRNETSRTYPTGLEETWVAALQAMEQLGYEAPEPEELGPLEAHAEFEDTADSIQLRAETLAEGGTRLQVRVGQFDNKNHRRKALVILQETTDILESDDELRVWSQKVQELKGEDGE